MIDEENVATGEFEVELDEEGNPIVPRVHADWLFRMGDAVEEMYRDKRFKVDHFESFRPPPEVVVSTLEHRLGLHIPETIMSLYHVTDGLELRWRFNDQDAGITAGGRVHLFGFGEVFGNWVDRIWGVVGDDASSEKEDFTWELRGFDEASDESDYLAVMHVPESLPTFNLYFYAPHGRVYRLDTDFVGYVEHLATTRGLNGWQYMISDADFGTDAVAREAVERCSRQMSSLFPEVDLGGYRTLGLDTDGDEEQE